MFFFLSSYFSLFCHVLLCLALLFCALFYFGNVCVVMFCFALSCLINTYLVFYLNKILYSKIFLFYFIVIYLLLLLCFIIVLINQIIEKYDMILYY